MKQTDIKHSTGSDNVKQKIQPTRQLFTAIPHDVIEKVLPLLTPNAGKLVLALYRQTIGFGNKTRTFSTDDLRAKIKTKCTVANGKLQYTIMSRPVLYKAKQELEIVGIINSPFALFKVTTPSEETNSIGKWILEPLDPLFNKIQDYVQQIQAHLITPETQEKLRALKKKNPAKVKTPEKKPTPVQDKQPGVSVPENGSRKRPAWKRPAPVKLKRTEEETKQELERQKLILMKPEPEIDELKFRDDWQPKPPDARSQRLVELYQSAVDTVNNSFYKQTGKTVQEVLNMEIQRCREMHPEIWQKIEEKGEISLFEIREQLDNVS